MTVMFTEIAEQIRRGNIEEAARGLSAIEKSDHNRGNVTFLEGYLRESQHDWEGAIDAYSKTLELLPDHAEATFRLALLLDQRGEDDQAAELFGQCLSGDRIHVNALLNQAVLLEEQGEFLDALECVERVLDEFPEHVRAKYLQRSIDASETMIFDERTQHERELHDAVRDVQVSDFELSVRSRNCLKQMDIKTLGDLLRTTEEELLSYKNFGETSLNEIKAMLTQKGLRLGQMLRDEKRPDVEVLAGEMPGDDDRPALLGKPVSEMELSVRSRKCLQRLGIITLGELVIRSEAELMATKNFGQTSLSEIKRQLAQIGLALPGPNPSG